MGASRGSPPPSRRLPTASDWRGSGRCWRTESAGQLLLELAQHVLGDARHRVEVVHGVEAVLALAVGDQAGRLGDRETEAPKILEGHLVDVEGRALAAAPRLGR